MRKKTLPLIKDDPWLEPFEDAIVGRHNDYLRKLEELTGKDGNLVDFANAYNYYGLHHDENGWTLREWAPTATDIFVIGDFNNWTECAPYKMRRLEQGGNWELRLPERGMKHGDLFKLSIHWRVDRASAFLPMPPAWCKMITPRFSRLRCGILH